MADVILIMKDRVPVFYVRFVLLFTPALRMLTASTRRKVYSISASHTLSIVRSFSFRLSSPCPHRRRALPIFQNFMNTAPCSRSEVVRMREILMQSTTKSPHTRMSTMCSTNNYGLLFFQSTGCETWNALVFHGSWDLSNKVDAYFILLHATARSWTFGGY